jgi:hypothetical protein
VRHTTVYRYRRPVRLQDHRLMLRPRDSHDSHSNQSRFFAAGIGALDSRRVRQSEPSAELRIESCLKLESYVVERPAFQLAPQAGNYPFIYSADDRIDLVRLRERQYPDPNNRLGSWARGFIHPIPPTHWPCWPI